MKVLLITVVLGGWVLTGAGCAVLTIDVDVYKGRLTDDRTIQTHQVIGLLQVANKVLTAMCENVTSQAAGLSGASKQGAQQFAKRLEELLQFYKGSGSTPGLDDLVNSYLVASYKGAADADAAASTQESKRTSSAPGREGLVLQLARFGEEIRSFSNEEMFRQVANESTGKSAQTNRLYVLALQAIGNAILVQVDEMRARDQYDRHKPLRFERELDALGAVEDSPLNHLTTRPSVLLKRDKDGKVQGSNDSRDVIDLVLSELEYEYLEEVKRHGQASPSATYIAEAIERAYEYRSGKIYLRPPSAYLRASYPVTSFQRGTNTSWDNMLTSHALRQLPFYDLFEGGQLENQVTREIDKQFWQNINQVRVSGAGNVNYAIAKDDIGNWYVKSYSTDVRKIIASAKNLALFAAGPAAGVAMANEVKAASAQANLKSTGGSSNGGAIPGDAKAAGTGQDGQANAAATTSPSDVAAERDALQKARQRYEARSKENYATIIADSSEKSLTTLSKARWADDVDASVANLDELARLVLHDNLGDLPVDDTASLSKSTSTDSPTECALAIRRVMRYHGSVQARIDALDAKGSAPHAAKDGKALDDATLAKVKAATKKGTTAALREQLLTFIDLRQGTVGVYDTQVTAFKPAK
jgi:hypothetical protein